MRNTYDELYTFTFFFLFTTFCLKGMRAMSEFFGLNLFKKVFKDSFSPFNPYWFCYLELPLSAYFFNNALLV